MEPDKKGGANMEQNQYPCCLPSIEMVADALLREGIACRVTVCGGQRTYRGVRV